MHVQQETRPSKKLTNNVTTNVKHGLLVVKHNKPLAPTCECIVVPRQVLEGLLTALHIQLCHPSSNQLKAVTKCYLYALDIDKAIDLATSVLPYVKLQKRVNLPSNPCHWCFVCCTHYQTIQTAHTSAT